MSAVVLVEGASDRIALETLARRQGRDLAGEGVSVVATGGAQAVGRVVADLRSTAASIAGLCDAGEEALFRRAGFGSTLYVCHADLEDELIRALGTDAVEGILEAGARGIVATNTTVTRPGTTGRTNQEGGLSGAPLWPLARERIATIVAAVRGRVPVVGVGGISRADQVRELLELGCACVQLYSGLIFEGPGLVRRLNRELEASA